MVSSNHAILSLIFNIEPQYLVIHNFTPLTHVNIPTLLFYFLFSPVYDSIPQVTLNQGFIDATISSLVN